MLKEDLDKRLEEIEAKIQELEDGVLENRLRLMEIARGEEKKSGSEFVKFDEKKKPEIEEVVPEPRERKPEKRPLGRIIKPKEEAPSDEIDDFRDRAKKLKEMLRELK